MKLLREDFLKQKIKESGLNQKEFAVKIEMPYSTLRSILESVGGASIDNIIKICGGLNITVANLQSIDEKKPLTTSTGEELDKSDIEIIELIRKIPSGKRPELRQLIESALKMLE